MNLNEAKQVLKKAGYVCETRGQTKWVLIDKQRNDDSEYGDDYNYEVVFGPATLRNIEKYLNDFTTHSIDDVPLNPLHEPEEGFIIRPVTNETK